MRSNCSSLRKITKNRRNRHLYAAFRGCRKYIHIAFVGEKEEIKVKYKMGYRLNIFLTIYFKKPIEMQI